MINRLVRLETATGNIASSLGYLALFWATVVLLGGFVGGLLLKEFWVLTALSFLMSFKMVDITNNEISKGIYMEEYHIIYTLRQQKWFKANKVIIIVLRMVQVLKWFFAGCFILIYFASPFVSLGVSVWRLVQRDYGDAGGGDAANRAKLAAALDIFYALIMFQSLFAFYYLVSFSMDRVLVPLTKEHCGLRDWSSYVVTIYYKETERKLKKDGELPDNWDLITFGVELLQSASGDDHLMGARVLDQLLDKDDNSAVRDKTLSSRLSIQNLIAMIGSPRGTPWDKIESRERAARIVVHLASELNITHFPGTLECICSLLGSCPSDNLDEDMISQGLLILERLTQDEENCAEISKHQRLLSKITSPLLICRGLQILERLTQDEENCAEISKHQRLLSNITSPLQISRGLQILEKLTRDEENCPEISKHQMLFSKLTSPLYSHDFLSNVQDDTMFVQMLSKSLTVLSRLLLTCPGDAGATRLRHELATNTEAVSNLMAILETDSEGAKELHGQALEILTELATFDESTYMLDKLLKTLRSIFLEENDGNTMVAEADREKAIRLRGKAGEAMARLLPVCAARDVNVAGILSKHDAINLLTKVLDQVLSSEMGTIAGAAIGDNVRQSDERKFTAAILSLAVVMHNENVISREDFARAIHDQDAALMNKLWEILKVNMHRTAECLRIVKLTCQVVIAMIQAKPSCIQHFNEHNFKEALTEALETMSKVDNCMLFAGNDREFIKPARSLASLVKKAQEHLETAQEQGN